MAGPSELAIDVKEALQFDLAGPRAILKGGPDVTLHVETYCIAVRPFFTSASGSMTCSLFPCPNSE